MNTASKKEQNIILSIHDVTNRFGKQVVHDAVSFDIRRGEIIGIVGGSGSGKSVLLKTMTGLRKPDKGEITIMGKPINQITSLESASLLGVLFQEGALFSSLTVTENITLPLREYTKLNKDQQSVLAQLKLALVGMPAESGNKYPAELSGGMTRRAALARALAMDPVMLFLDEPTSALDPINASLFDELILNLNRAMGITVVMATHDLDTIFTVCDRIAVLVDSKIIVDTLPNLLKHNNPWIRKFLHSPRAKGASVAANDYSGGIHGN